MKRRNYTLRDGTLSALHFGDISAPLEARVSCMPMDLMRKLIGLYWSRWESMRLLLICAGMETAETLPQPSNMPNWHIFRDDCAEFFDRHLPDLTGRPVVLAGHSFGAVTGILAAPFLKDKIHGYVGFDPVSVPLMFRLTSALPGGRAYMKRRVSIARNAGRRKSVFQSPARRLRAVAGSWRFQGYG